MAERRDGSPVTVDDCAQISRTLSSSDNGIPGTSGGAQRFMNWLYYPDGSLQNFTDTGTPASHAGIAAREYGLPSVVGTGIATAVIPEGAIVTVDGTSGTVRLD